MSKVQHVSLKRLSEVLNALDRCFMVGGSPGVKLAAGMALELLTGIGQGGRPLAARARANVSFSVSVTILSCDMENVLVRTSRRGHLLPRERLDEMDDAIHMVALRLSRHTCGDGATELALLGRPLSIELWDDDPEQMIIGLNYLAIARSEDSHGIKTLEGWHYVQLNELNLNAMDPRECLALSEMLSIMGFSNPYAMDEEEETPLDIYPAA